MTVERVVSGVLFWGGVLGIALMLVGLLGVVARAGLHGTTWDPGEVMDQRGAGHAAHVFTSVAQVGEGLRRRPIDPLAIAAVGVLVLLATPIAATATAIPAFLLAGERSYAAIAALLVSALAASLLVGGG
jgi:uncharacterized membrane protein